jgi:hypothetical protein
MDQYHQFGDGLHTVGDGGHLKKKSIGLIGSDMHCAVVAMLRNEADVIEVWARYNLRLLDRLQLIDLGPLSCFTHQTSIDILYP